jgi:hypothetical protein
MGSKPGKVTQGDVSKILKSAKRAGAAAVVLDLGGGVLATINLDKAPPAPPAGIDEWKVAS